MCKPTFAPSTPREHHEAFISTLLARAIATIGVGIPSASTSGSSVSGTGVISSNSSEKSRSVPSSSNSNVFPSEPLLADRPLLRLHGRIRPPLLRAPPLQHRHQSQRLQEAPACSTPIWSRLSPLEAQSNVFLVPTTTHSIGPMLSVPSTQHLPHPRQTTNRSIPKRWTSTRSTPSVIAALPRWAYRSQPGVLRTGPRSQRSVIRRSNGG